MPQPVRNSGRTPKADNLLEREHLTTTDYTLFQGAVLELSQLHRSVLANPEVAQSRAHDSGALLLIIEDQLNALFGSASRALDNARKLGSTTGGQPASDAVLMQRLAVDMKRLSNAAWAKARRNRAWAASQ